MDRMSTLAEMITGKGEGVIQEGQEMAKRTKTGRLGATSRITEPRS